MATQAAQLTLEQVKFSLLSARIKLNSSWVVSAGEIAAFRSDERENALVCVTGCRDLLWKKYMFAAFPWHLPSLVMKCCLIRKSRHLTEHDLNINNERTLVCADVCHVTVATFPLARQEVSLVNRKSFHICSVVTQVLHQRSEHCASMAPTDMLWNITTLWLQFSTAAQQQWRQWLFCCYIHCC